MITFSSQLKTNYFINVVNTHYSSLKDPLYLLIITSILNEVVTRFCVANQKTNAYKKLLHFIVQKVLSM